MENNYVKWLRWALIGGLFASLLIPFYIAHSSFFPFITGKNFAFRILVELLFGAYVLLALREPEYRPRFSWVLVAAGLFTLWAGLAVLTSVDPVKSFWSNFERMEGYITILHLFAYFLVASAVLHREKLWMWYLRLSVAASVLMGVYGVLQVVGVIPIDQGSTRVDGTLGNAIYFAVYMLFNIFFGLILLKREWGNMLLRYAYIAAIIFDTVMLFYSETRGTILGLVGGLLIAAAYIVLVSRYAPDMKRLRQWSVGFVAIMVIGAGGLFAMRHHQFVQTIPGVGRVASISLANSETTTRLTIWQMAFEGFKEKPITGWGQDNFNFVFNKYYNPELYGQEQWFDRAHNAYIDWLINAGAPGFLLFVSLVVLTAWAILRARDLSIPERAALLGLTAGFAIHEIFVFDNIVSSMQFFTLLAFAHILSRRHTPLTMSFSRPLSQNGMAIAAPIVVVATLGGAWFFNAAGIANATEMISALSTTAPSGTSVNLTDNLSHFENVLSRGQLGKQEATEQLVQFTLQLSGTQNISPQAVQSFYTASHNAIEAMVKQRPNDARLEQFYGVLLDGFAQYEEGYTHLSLAHSLSPNKQSILYEIGLDNQLPAGDTSGALSTLKEAYDLAPENDQALVYYAQALYTAGQSGAADALITKHFGSLTSDNDTLLQMYFNAKQYSRALAILQKRLSQDPNATLSYLQIAQVYYSEGDKQNAVAILQEGAKAVPSFASQANQLIQQIQQEQQ